jgi:hypothetical protein
MAQIFSLICWGGKDGKSVTFTDAGDVVNLTNHGLRDGTGVVFTDNGNTLPTGLSKDTTYYAKQGADANKFTLWDVTLTTQVTFSGTGSGTHKVKSAYYVGLSDKSRWTYDVAGTPTEFIFDSLENWNTHRTTTVPASSLDSEVAELGMAMYEHLSGVLSITVPAAIITITSSINGVRTPAYHYGVLDAGYVVVRSLGASSATAGVPYRGVYDGFTIKHTNGGYNPSGLSVGLMATARYMVVIGVRTQSGYGISAGSAGAKAEFCVSVGFTSGYEITYGTAAQTIQNCIATKNTTGFSAVGSSGHSGFFYNNISVGNITTNWGAISGSFTGNANAGQDDGSGGYTGGTPWLSTGGTGI